MRTWVCSDIHGDRKLWDEAMKIVGPDDKVYFLGDAVDRGEDGWEILKEILADPRFVMLKGNHEDMMVKAIYEEDIDWFYIWRHNGCSPTYNAMVKTEGQNKEILKKIKNLPIHMTITNKNGTTIYLSHSGYGPWNKDKWDNDFEKNCVWNREHFLDPLTWDNEDCILIHGHSPVYHVADCIGYKLKDIEPGAFWYDDGHKCCIDMGTYLTKYFVIMDIDTFEEFVYSAEEE